MQSSIKIKNAQKQKQTLTQTQGFYLNILEMNAYDIQNLIEKQMEENPLLEQDFSLENGCINRYEDNFELMLNHVIKEETLVSVVEKEIMFNDSIDDVDLAVFLTNLLDDNGYLLFSNEHIHKYKSDRSLESIEKTILELQELEPYGIFARSLSECLLIQLNHMMDSSITDLAKQIVKNYMEELASFQNEKIAHSLNVKNEDVLEAIKLIKTLDPRPGSAYAQTATYLYPDVLVTVEGEEASISLLKNNYGLYVSDVTVKGEDSDTMNYLKKKKKDAELLIDGIKKRNLTLLETMQELIKFQSDYFFNSGSLKPLTLKTLAEALNIHESTISRCINSKSMIFNGDIIPLKYLFSKDTQKENHDLVSSKLIEIIQSEDKSKPYSDEKLAELLRTQGFSVTRRTITKYRDQLNIGTKSQRKISG